MRVESGVLRVESGAVVYLDFSENNIAPLLTLHSPHFLHSACGFHVEHDSHDNEHDEYGTDG